MSSRPATRIVTRPPGDDGTDDVASRLWRAMPVLYQAVAVAAALIGVLLLLAGEPALGSATLALALFVSAVLVLSRVWNRLDPPVRPRTEVSHTAAFRAQAAALVTLQAVVLTLVLTLAGDDASPTVKVAAVALVVGVLLGLVQGGLVALGVSGSGQVAIATLVFNLTMWACGYGLLCLAAELVLER